MRVETPEKSRTEAAVTRRVETLTETFCSESVPPPSVSSPLKDWLAEKASVPASDLASEEAPVMVEAMVRSPGPLTVMA